jgi:hypothetical protein
MLKRGCALFKLTHYRWLATLDPGQVSWLNIKQAARPLLDKKFRKRIAIEYAPEVSKLSSVLDRDLLSIWIAPLI